MRVGLVGCGRMGRKRATALGADTLVGCVDDDPALARELAAGHGAQACDSLAGLLALRPDAVIVATTPDALAAVGCSALTAGAHVLVEKPAGTCAADVTRLKRAAEQAGRHVRAGFNHRFHPGIARAVEEASSGRFGPVLSLRGRYGHGGRPGYETEWRFDRAVAGGGQLVDQGMHLLDLAHWLLGPLPLHSSLLRSSYWPGEVEDTAVLLLGGVGRAGPFAALHASWAEWKNLFSLEIACRSAKLQVDGLTGSYGAQRLTVYAMRPELGPPDVESVDYPAEDLSWALEWQAFRDAVQAGAPPALASAGYAWAVIEDAYAREPAA